MVSTVYLKPYDRGRKRHTGTKESYFRKNNDSFFSTSPELKAVNAKYEGKEKGEIEHQIKAAEHNTMGKESSTAYLRYVNDPAYIPRSAC